MSFLFLIPEDILVNVFSQLCTVDDLGRLDTAICSVKGRSKLLKIFCSPGFDLHDNVTLRGMQFCADKGIAMKYIVLFQRDFTANRHRNIKIDTLNTQKVAELDFLNEFNGTMTFCYQLANRCHALEKMTITGCAGHVDMFVTSLSAAILHNLKTFTSNQSDFGIKSCKYLAEHCKLLESVSVDYSGTETDIPELDIESLLINNYCKSLKKISLFRRTVSNLTNKSLQCVIDHCPRIEQLTLGFDDEVLVSLSLVNQLLTKCTSLTDFILGSGGEGSEISLSHSRPYNKKISTVVMLDPLVTNEHELIQFFSHAKQINVMQLVGVPLLSATTLNTIARHNSTSLGELLIGDCSLVITSDVITLINALPELTDFNVSACPLVDKHVVEKYIHTHKSSHQ